MKKVIFVFGSVKKRNRKMSFIKEIRAYFAPVQVEVFLAKEMHLLEGKVLVFSNLKLEQTEEVIVVSLIGLTLNDAIQEIKTFLC